MGKTAQELVKLRADLLGKVASADFDWYDVKLEYKMQNGTVGNVTVKVCNPLRKDGFYLPVTAKETFDFAKKFGWLPLTRAVADQAHNQATQFTYKPQAPDLLDFEKYTVDTLDKSYGPSYAAHLVSGSHKLWILSKVGKATNYGFYAQADQTHVPNGPRLKGWYVIQTRGGAHNATYWDYSQLLQLMKADTLNIDGTNYSLSAAVVAGLEAVWDEGSKLQASDLPTPP
ncbi:MAG: hypothetical protein LAQ69_19660 [Acidobacteriia bacterium]|nr:hypothetical protein [Terriglobia bacterium]